ncbi:Hypothetical predicted protein [Marmota monax]|uniref:Uncharacterized protein n=1 Tax=Marmota monax TaxID=9995 RepID=A0A5E4CLX7_MARMO|nr:hypothetical protein GHT09_011991 [Marmota monax]VTJ82847.1 Hypothetical predicted protein [Marmota monax]
MRRAKVNPERLVEALLRNGGMTLKKCCAPPLTEWRHFLKRREKSSLRQIQACAFMSEEPEQPLSILKGDGGGPGPLE